MCPRTTESWPPENIKIKGPETPERELLTVSCKFRFSVGIINFLTLIFVLEHPFLNLFRPILFLDQNR